MDFKIHKTGALLGKLSRANIKYIEAFIFAFCLFLLIPPFYVWHKSHTLFFVAICSVLALKNYDKKWVKFVNSLILFMGLLFVYCHFTLSNDRNIFGYIAIMLVCTLFIASGDFLHNVFDKFVFIYSITLVPSIIVFLLLNLFNVNLLLSDIAPLNELKSYNYSVYPFLVQPNIGYIIMPRFCGLYDEPGVVGTISAVLLMCSGFNLKKARNFPILIAGILSFSLAFYLATFIYVLAFFPLRYKIFTIIIIVVGLYFLSDNVLVNRYVFSRIQFENGEWTGDNRSVQGFDKWFKEFKETDNYYFGVGLTEAKNQNPGGASYKELIAAYGILGFSYYIGIFILIAFYQLRFEKKYFIYLFLFFSIIYQRPFITSYFYAFLIFASIFNLKKSDNKKTNLYPHYKILRWRNRFFRCISNASVKSTQPL